MRPAPQTPATHPQNRELTARLCKQIEAAGGWLPFDAFMQQALYAPGLGYYARPTRKFGAWASSGSDFVTAPELSPLFARALAVQVAEALQHTGTDEIWEFGAGSGALADGLLQALEELEQPLRRYHIVDLSGVLRARQQERLARFGPRMQWADRLPDTLRGVVLGNELLDAVPVKLLARADSSWQERGVTWDGAAFDWADRPTTLQPPVAVAGQHPYVTEIHPQAEALVRTLAEKLVAGGAGAAFFIDYGFPEAEYYHPQRSSGTLVCHQAHRMDADPLSDVGAKDITAHVNFTGIALAAQDAGLIALGYTSQGRFLLNCGMAEIMGAATLPQSTLAMKLIHEHEMGELFKVLGLATGNGWQAVGFAAGDRTHRL